MSRKKIALIIYSLSMGGAEKVLADLSLEYIKLYDVVFILFDSRAICYPYAGKLIDLKLHSVDGILPKFINIIKRVFSLKKVFNEQRFDYIISFMEHANFPVIMANKNAVVANHCNPNVFSKAEWLFSRWLYPQAKKVVAVSKAGKEIFKSKIELKNITYLHNPINLAAIDKKMLEAADLPAGSYILGIGRLRPEKNFQSLIRAFAQADLPDYTLLILGDGSEYDALTTLIQTMNLHERVFLKGFITNPYPYLAHAKCLVLSSLHEGFPVVIAESLACSCPVIATRCETGPDEIIEHEKNGLLIPVNDDTALTAALKRLLSDPVLYGNIKQQTRSSVQHLDIRGVAKKWLEF